MIDIVRKYGVFILVIGSDVIKFIKFIKYICWNNFKWVKVNVLLYIKKICMLYYIYK